MPLDEIDYGNNQDTHFDVDDKINQAITKINEIDDGLPGGTTDQILKKSSGTDYDKEWTNSVLPGSGISGNIKIKKLSIGDWNMDATASVSVNHGLSDITKVINIKVLILPDTGTGITPLDAFVDPLFTVMNGGVSGLGSTTITLARLASGFFDGATYDAMSFNRGYIYITYEE